MLRAALPVLVLLLISLAIVPSISRADVIAAINEARQHGCRPSASIKLRENARLNEAAQRLARGENMQDATKRAGYRSMSSAALQVTNVPTDRDVLQFALKRFCPQITGPELRDIGAYRRGADIWLLVAAPFVPPAPADRQAVARRVLELTNRARSQSRRCGAERFPAVPPLILGPATLERAAAEHSQDMASHNYMDHIGRDRSSPADRVTRAGYKWSAIGENLASGITSPDETVNGWLGSPHHCANLMTARFTEMAIAYAVNPSSSGGIYWTQLFGTPPRKTQ